IDFVCAMSDLGWNERKPEPMVDLRFARDWMRSAIGAGEARGGERPPARPRQRAKGRVVHWRTGERQLRGAGDRGVWNPHADLRAFDADGWPAGGTWSD